MRLSWRPGTDEVEHNWSTGGRYSGEPGLKRKGETSRVVPFTERTLAAIDAMPPRIDTLVMFPAAHGGRINVTEWRSTHWLPAFKAAGIEYRTLYDCRHTAISWALSAGVPPAKVALIYGTSIKMIDGHYSHLIAPDLDDFRSKVAEWTARVAT